MIATLAFYLFATLTIAPAIAVIFARNPVHSVLWLIVAFFNAAGLMLLLGAEFIAMLLVIVYVGAVAVLFLFVVMMLNIDFAVAALGLHPQPAVRAHDRAGAACRDRRRGQRLEGRAGAQRRHIADRRPAQHRRARAAALQPYLFPFEIAGLILLVAMIGAIVLTHRRRGDTRTPKASRQIAAGPEDATRLTQPGVGEGMKL